jgi:lipoprotein NlpI
MIVAIQLFFQRAPRFKFVAMVLALLCASGRSEESVYNKAIAFVQAGKPDDAIKVLTLAIASDSKDASLYKLRSRIYSQSNDHAKAADDMNHVAEMSEPNAFRHAGAEYFFAGKFDASIAAFDAYAKHFPEQAPHLWERGISLYYATRYADGRKQFEEHKSVNPHDVENAAWHFICAAKEMGVDAARKAIIFIDTTKDTRVPMKEVYLLFKGELKPRRRIAQE